jgi:hypothetical protein
MTKIQIGIYDHLTGENIVRDATNVEIAAIEAERETANAAKSAAAAKIEKDALAKEALLNRLGITAEEATLLLG